MKGRESYGNTDEYKTLLSGEVVEWARIEFKETWDAESSLKSVCAFANDLDNWGGGYIVIGVEENEGQPVYPLKGVPADRIDGCQKSILAKCKLIRPAYMPIVEVADYENKKFIVLWCPGGDSRPYSSPKTMAKDNKERIHYIRKMSNTVEPADDEEKDLFNLANRIPFDDRVNHQAEMSDLNITLIQNYLKEVKSSLYEKSRTGDFVEVCRDMNIISNLPEYTKPKNVGLMFFSMEPDKFFPYTQIDVVQFPDGLGGDHIIEQTFKGPIHQQLREALQYIRNTIITEKVVKHSDRAEADRFFNYPFAAIEEALSNAVYHRAYDEREPIEVRVSKKEPKKELKKSQKGAEKRKERKQAIVQLLAENPAITQVQIMEKLNLTRKQIQTDIRELQEEGTLVREGSNRKGHWVLKHHDEISK